MTGHALARLLNPFGIASRNHRFPDGTRSKAYFATAFESAWEAYFPESGGFKASQRPKAAVQGVSGDFNPSRPDPLGTDADRTKPYENRDWDVGTLRSPRNNGTAPAPVSLSPQPPNRPMAGEAYRNARDGEYAPRSTVARRCADSGRGQVDGEVAPVTGETRYIVQPYQANAAASEENSLPP